MAIHFDTQGPAPDGFHVPLQSEWSALCGILTSTFRMAGNATTLGTYLKMPTAGYRSYGNAGVSGAGSTGYYWSSSPFHSDANYAYDLYFHSGNIYPDSNYGCANGYSVRCFKDTSAIPTSSWTTLYQGSGSAGVFWNSTDGLISVSGDGTNWYTIMDKNLGATTVYNQGDTVTDDNCGYFYQWGNNYGFAHSGTLTTSSTQVDASNYGPGNYYESSTFIIGNANWSNVQNGNLWGGVSQGTWETPDPTYKLHGAIQTFHRAPSGPSLKSYEEIVAIGNCVDIVNELNQHPLEYLSSLTAEGHIYRTYSEIMYIDLLTNTSDSDRVRLKETSSSSRTFNIWYAEGREEGEEGWTYGSPAVIPSIDL